MSYKEPIINVGEKPSTGKYVTSLNCELISNQDISYLEGQLKTFLETLGLQEKQEKSTKNILTTILWNWYCFIRDHKTDHLKEKSDWYKNKNQETK